jgi:hypothetical protein
MDPIAASDYAAADLSSKVSIKVARKVLDQEQEAGDAAVQMLQQAVEMQKSLSDGRRLDVYA